MISEIQVFIQVVDSNSFYKAANVLKMSPASVTRKIAKLEASLGVTLLNRNTRRFSLTSYGEYCYQHCQMITGLMSELHQSIADKIKSPKGTLHLSIAAYSGYMELIPIISGFIKKFPLIKINYFKSNIYPDFIEDTFDFYFRYKEVHTRTLQSQKLIEHQLICCASPHYLQHHGVPEHPHDLIHHNCIIHQINLYEGEIWDFEDNHQLTSLTATGNLRVNNSALALEAVMEGIGIARLPQYFFQKHLNNGELIEVLANYRCPPLAVWLIHPRNQHMSYHHKIFMEYIVEAYHCLNSKNTKTFIDN
ncbi:LysR family transcriptional regulator [Legionella sainthelensi]|uniref:LysR family transcriptional regulator n=1 Tax=Legionella sainthelensi TaxID=28087 RepID=UPI000E20593F|nr:LysR family transcriptional regulator [Legionella sainthelensi]